MANELFDVGILDKPLFDDKSFDKVSKIEPTLRISLALMTGVLAAALKENIVNEIKDQDLVASGTLLKSVSYSVLRPTTTGFTSTVSVDAPYAKQVLEGQPGGVFPNIGKILEWMQHRGITGGRPVAFRIARKIFREGTQPKDFISKPLEDLDKDFASASDLVRLNLQRI